MAETDRELRVAKRKLHQVEAEFRKAFEARGEEMALLEELAQGESSLRVGEREHLQWARAAYDRGFECWLSRVEQTGCTKRLELVQSFLALGPKGLLMAGNQRPGGDFLTNQLRGHWAERAALSLRLDALELFPFGPSSAAMPGDADYRSVVATVRMVTLLEGKRPDLIAFDADQKLSASERRTITDWPVRLLQTKDRLLLGTALCGIEVKSATWAYKIRRKTTGGILSVTVKEEEIPELNAWRNSTGLPVVFFQVMFDELYCMSFKRMLEAKARGHLYEEGDYSAKKGSGGKLYHRFQLRGDEHLCATVAFPNESEAVVKTLEDGAVVPHIVFKPASADLVNEERLLQEIQY